MRGDLDFSRRDFLRASSKSALVLCGACAALSSPAWLKEIGRFSSELFASDNLSELIRTAPVARYWVSSTQSDCSACHVPEVIERHPAHRHDRTHIRCLLCAQNCLIAPNERGRCRSRVHVNGELRSLVYGRPITTHVDPIEKKPFYHFLPGAQAYSLATSGCPLSCQFCQNWEISQIHPEDYEVRLVSPEAVAASASLQQAPVIAFTYNEPTVFTEYLLDIATAAKPFGIRSVLISCGFMNELPLRDMCETLDAIKVDLKGFSEDFYRRVCAAELKPVLRSIKQIAQSGTHLEIVNLVVPTLNDSKAMLSELIDWLLNEVGPDVPLHFTRFHPDYKLLNLPPTPVATLEEARALATSKGLHYCYVGNVPGHPGNHTYCPNCAKPVIERNNFFLKAMHVQNGQCEFCGAAIAGIWS